MTRKSSPVDNASGSPTGEPVYLAVGYIRRPHGTHGELLMDVHTEFPERLRKGARVFVGETYKPYKLVGIRPSGNALLVSFLGLNSPEKAGILRNSWVYVKSVDIPPLLDGNVYQHQVLGFSVITDQNDVLGTLVDIFETGANKIYVVKTKENSELLLPAIPDVIINIDLDNRRIMVHLLEGLLG
jgi:16S rRNA processing protein RimM